MGLHLAEDPGSLKVIKHNEMAVSSCTVTNVYGLMCPQKHACLMFVAQMMNYILLLSPFSSTN